MEEDKKVIENRISRFKILRDRATNQILADSYQKQIDELKAPPVPEKKKFLSKYKGD